jgi:dipeptidyl aminopeptidase/acylaminoacyl peptidase
MLFFSERLVMKYSAILVINLLIFTSFLLPQKRAFTIDDLYKVKYVGAPVLSHSGGEIAFTVTNYDLKKGKSNVDIYKMKTDGTDIRPVINSENSEYNPFWSRDDSKIYYLKDAQLYSYDTKTNASTVLTDWPAGISNPVLSPDGNLVAFATDVFPECGTDADCNRRLLKSSEDGPLQAYVADSLMFRHWTHYKGERETHLFIYNLITKKYTGIAHSELLSDMYKLGGDVKYNFSPDGKEICFVNNPDGSLAVSTNSDLFIAPVEGGSPVDITPSNKSWDGSPVYSPDGKYIAFRMQLTPKYEADRYRIALYDRQTKKITNLTEDFDNTIGTAEWGGGSKSIYFTSAYQGYSPVYKLDLSNDKISKVTDDESVFGFEVSPDGKSVYYLASKVDRPAELFSFNTDSKISKAITSFNKKLLDEVDVRPAEKIMITGADGIKVETFIVKPHGFDPSKKYPLILNVHGGPQGQWMDSFRGDWQVYPGAGYVVAFPNPHGSTGYGSDYTKEISGDWGGKVFRDLMKVTDSLMTLPYVDTSRVGAMGWSFGGYMMDWFEAQTHRFKCLASMMGIFDIGSMWGATEELWFVNWDLKGQPWNSDLYSKFSPSSYVKNFSTPALIITGERDYRVPYTQSIEFFTTLQSLGIDSRLIIFKNDGHWPDVVKSMPLYYNAHLEWFHKYLGGNAAPYELHNMVKNAVAY